MVDASMIDGRRYNYGAGGVATDVVVGTARGRTFKKKAEETAQRKKDGTIKEVKQKEIYKIIESDRKLLREMCIDFIKGKGSLP